MMFHHLENMEEQDPETGFAGCIAPFSSPRMALATVH